MSLTCKLWNQRKNLHKRIDSLVLLKPRKMPKSLVGDLALYDESIKVFCTGTHITRHECGDLKKKKQNKTVSQVTWHGFLTVWQKQMLQS